jgi:serine/threonine-protein kinase
MTTPLCLESIKGNGLRRVPANGGSPQLVTTVNASTGEVGHYWPNAVPGGRQVLFTLWKGTNERSQVGVVSLKDGSVSTLVSSATFPAFRGERTCGVRCGW